LWIQGVQDEYWDLLSPLLQQFYGFQTKSSSIYGDPFYLLLVFVHHCSQLIMSSQGLCIPS
jgi:hypothetical protein